MWLYLYKIKDNFKQIDNDFIAGDFLEAKIDKINSNRVFVAKILLKIPSIKEIFKIKNALFLLEVTLMKEKINFNEYEALLFLADKLPSHFYRKLAYDYLENSKDPSMDKFLNENLDFFPNILTIVYNIKRQHGIDSVIIKDLRLYLREKLSKKYKDFLIRFNTLTIYILFFIIICLFGLFLKYISEID
ncbi:MAG: hypothetical protein GF347_03480 [Candidatus Moranbacteria bacterium]|nr:hypothetical protein [Candidatus Moranbacteria bacterium]